MQVKFMNRNIEHFRQRLPPFIGLQTVAEGSEEHARLSKSPLFFKGPHNALLAHMQHAYDLTIDARIRHEFKTLSGDIGAFDSKSAANPEWTIPWLQELVGSVLSNLDRPNAESATEVSLIYPTSLKPAVRKMIHKLILHPQAADIDQRVVSIGHAGKTRVLNVSSFEFNIGAGISGKEAPFVFCVYSRDNPPLAIAVAESGPIEFHPGSPDSTEEVEQLAFDTLTHQLAGLGTVVASVVREPAGRGKFPDFGFECNGTDWFVEVTRILGNIRENRVIDVAGRDVEAMANLAASTKPINSSDIEAALDQALDKKRSKANHVPRDCGYCLLLVDEFGPDYWDGVVACSQRDLAEFDAVVIVRSTPTCRATFVKGDPTTIPISARFVGG